MGELKTRIMKYENVIFDLYGTLVDILTDESPLSFWQGVATLYLAKGAKYGAKELRDEYLRIIKNEFVGQGEFFEPDLYKVFKVLFSQKSVVATKHIITEVAVKFRQLSTIKLNVYDGVIEALKKLKESGVKIYLLSNAQALFTIYELKLLGLYKLFDDIFISSDWAVSKPSERFFELPIKKHHLDITKTLMVGNDPICDIQGAKKMGLDTVYFKTETSPQDIVPQANYLFDGCQIKAVADIVLG